MVLGLTGGSASGKTTIAGLFAERGAVVLDCDTIARELVDSGSVHWARVLEEFGHAYASDDGSIDRTTLGKKVFAHRTSLLNLNSLIHPALFEVVNERIKDSTSELVVVDAAVLIEAGLYRLCDYTCLAVASSKVRLQRLMCRSGLDAVSAQSRIDAQTGSMRMRQFCCFVVNTTDGLHQTTHQVARIFETIADVIKGG